MGVASEDARSSQCSRACLAGDDLPLPFDSNTTRLSLGDAKQVTPLICAA